MSEFHVQLKKAMSLRNINQNALCEKTKIPKSAMSQYVSGSFKPKQKRTYLIAKALNVNEAWLMGFDNVPMERNMEFKNPSNIDLSQYGITPVKTQRIPLLGEIACGEPIFADEDRESYVEVGTEIKADFCLRAKGNSMINARIYDGDIVFIRKQSMVDNGDIAAVIIDNEATLKRVYYYPEKGKLILNPENPACEPLVYVGEELNEIRILGKAVAFQSDL